MSVLPNASDVRTVSMVNAQRIVDRTGDPARLAHSSPYGQLPPEMLLLTIRELEFRVPRTELRKLSSADL